MGENRDFLRLLSTVAASTTTVFKSSMGALIDFAVADRCYLCGRPASRGAEPNDRLPPVSRCLAGEAVVPVLRLIPVVNHPFCGACLAQLRPTGRSSRITLDGGHYLDVCAPFWMGDATLEIVHLIKFSHRLSLVRLVAAAMAHSLRARAAAGPQAILVPVPMHPSALRRRGFNQAELLASAVARSMDGPAVCRALRKTIRTPRQSETDPDRRADNVRGVFRWQGAALSNSDVVLVDDLVTTGATVASCAGVLMAAGARRVTVVCLAKAL